MRRLTIGALALWLLICPARAEYKQTGAPAATALTSAQLQGTAFRPCPNVTCMLTIMVILTTLVSVNVSVTISESPTQSGTYVTVANQSVPSTILTAWNQTVMAQVPSGYWIKVTISNFSLLSSYSGSYAAWAGGN